MMAFNKKHTIALIFLILSLFTSCERLVHTKYELEVVFDNQIETLVNAEVITNVGNKNIFITGNNVDSVSIINEQVFDSGLFGHNEISNEYMVNFNNYHIYNINDTTSLEYSSCDSIEQNILDKNSNTTFYRYSFYSEKYYCILTIDSTLLPIFKKDYNMLDLFSEYYE
jgi:hypothetical protein